MTDRSHDRSHDRATARRLADYLTELCYRPALDPAWTRAVRDACPYDVAPARAFGPAR